MIFLRQIKKLSAVIGRNCSAIDGQQLLQLADYYCFGAPPLCRHEYLNPRLRLGCCGQIFYSQTAKFTVRVRLSDLWALQLFE
uniref:Uncharacterized protein n=1 Tax=Globodera rostochiensis TaxID=31243 RepID=A0A914H5F1_GLORO